MNAAEAVAIRLREAQAISTLLITLGHGTAADLTAARAQGMRAALDEFETAPAPLPAETPRAVAADPAPEIEPELDPQDDLAPELDPEIEPDPEPKPAPQAEAEPQPAPAPPACGPSPEQAALLREIWPNPAVPRDSIVARYNAAGPHQVVHMDRLYHHAAKLNLRAPKTGTISKWTPERKAALAVNWPRGETLDALFARVAAMPGPPITSRKAVEDQVQEMKLRRDPAVLSAIRAAKVAEMRAARHKQPASPAAESPPPAPPPPAMAPAPAPPLDAYSAEDRIARGLALLREGHTETVIATRTGMPIAEARRLIAEAEARARDLLLTGGLSSEGIQAATSLPIGAIRALRREIAGDRAA
jgi:hypothetical protein